VLLLSTVTFSNAERRRPFRLIVRPPVSTKVSVPLTGQAVARFTVRLVASRIGAP